MSRTGKIARLPKEIREQLNRRLQDGETGVELVKWLNELPDCKEILAEKFAGRPITEGNLSDWRQGGYEDWLRHEGSRGEMRWLIERARDLDGEGGGTEVSDLLGGLVAGEIASALAELDQITDRKERWQRVQEISRELSRLRREDHQDKRLQIVESRWSDELERKYAEEHVANEKAEREKLEKIFWGTQQQKIVAKMLGGDDKGKKLAELWFSMKHGLPLPDWFEKEAGVNGGEAGDDPGKSG